MHRFKGAVSVGGPYAKRRMSAGRAVAMPTCHRPTALAPPSKCRPRPAGAAPTTVAGAAALRSRGAAHQPDQARRQHNLRLLQFVHRGPVSFSARAHYVKNSL